ncbi:hypothetical protein ON010_g8300 [Phytophthora cinnamomi]|nr:hypothetical protein ON010_g8300 [Phytophthora cinnamomi]
MVSWRLRRPYEAAPKRPHPDGLGHSRTPAKADTSAILSSHDGARAAGRDGARGRVRGPRVLGRGRPGRLQPVQTGARRVRRRRGPLVAAVPGRELGAAGRRHNEPDERAAAPDGQAVAGPAAADAPRAAGARVPVERDAVVSLGGELRGSVVAGAAPARGLHARQVPRDGARRGGGPQVRAGRGEADARGCADDLSVPADGPSRAAGRGGQTAH